MTAGTSAKLDVFHDCFQFETTTVNKVRETQTWWSILERLLSDWLADGVEVVCAGVAGDTAEKGLARLERDVLSQSPDYVLVMFGAEDALAGVEAETFRKNLETIVNGITARNARPILMTPLPFSERMTAQGLALDEVRRRQGRLSDLAQVVRSRAEEQSLPLIDLHRYFLSNRLAYDHLFEGWLPDGVAQSAMASFVAAQMAKMLGIEGFPKVVLCDHRKIYSNLSDPKRWHNAFTDLTYFEGRFCVGFRSEGGHCSENGIAMVLSSEDGISWEEEGVLDPLGLQDGGGARFLQAEGRLIAQVFTPLCGPRQRVTYGFERLGPAKWGEPFECAPGPFFNAIRWRDQYVVAGFPVKEEGLKLLSSPDGRTWKIISEILPRAVGPSETNLFAENDQLMAFSRTGYPSQCQMLVSTYSPGENRWGTSSCGRVLLAHPSVFKVGGRLFVSSRTCAYPDDEFPGVAQEFGKVGRGEPDANSALAEKYHHGLRTGIFVLDGTRARQVAELLSDGDSSYMGVVQYGDELVLSDYSMHEYYRPIKDSKSWETPSDIYLRRLRFGG